ncbi:hypothetical protein IW261DRAFT_1426993 [Armillaria novae-zelandiae]|uniref:Uncharacterized protein n=1 Tax=Armillaria novae-zelandiae TaxID=153914 RepID=A0AA39NHP6_9AGAR|nr:hypothetical protein IW261DRAFT_1426993 [Armillaria novae-zelandiae]
MAKNRAQSTRTRYKDSDFDTNQTREAGRGHRQRKENTEALADVSLAKSNKICEACQRWNVHANDSPIDVATNIDRVAGISASETTSSKAPRRHATLNTTPITTSTRNATAPTQASASNTPVDTSTTSAGPPDHRHLHHQHLPQQAQRSAPFEMIDPPNQVGPNLNLGSMYTNHGQPFASSGRNCAALRPTEDFSNDLPSHGDPDTTNLEPFQFPSHKMDDFIQANIMGHGTSYSGTNFDMLFIDPLELGSRGHTNVGGNESGHLSNTITSSWSQAGMALDYDDNDVHGSESWHDVKLSDDLSQLSNDQDLNSDTGSTSMPYQTDTRKVRLTVTTSSSNCQLKIMFGLSDHGSTSKPPSSKAKIKFTTSWEMIDKSNSQESSYMLAMAWDAACNHLDLDKSEITNPTAQEENLNIQNLRNPSQERIDAAKAENRALVQFLKGDEDPMRFVYSIKCAIDEWSTGMHKTCTFTADTYSQDQDLCTELQEMLYDNACNTAGISKKDGPTSNATGGHGRVGTNNRFLWNQM